MVGGAAVVTGTFGLIGGFAIGSAWERLHRYRRRKSGVVAPSSTAVESEQPRLKLVSADVPKPSLARMSHSRTFKPAIGDGMTQDLWNSVDDYFSKMLLPPDAALDLAIASSTEAGLPAIQVSANQGKQLEMLARMQKAHFILEIGTLGGYSTIWMARALAPGGRLITLESDPKHADVARTNIERAGFGDVVEVRTGLALDTLPLIAAENAGPFDMIFIDADKENIPGYFKWALELSRPGSLIVVDNVVREGAVIDAASDDLRVQGVRRLMDYLSREPRVTATAIQTVGTKGYDGFVMAIVKSEDSKQ